MESDETHRSAPILGASVSRRALALRLVPPLLAAAVYANTLGGGFVWDDVQLIPQNPAIKSWSLLTESLDEDFFFRNENRLAYGYYRPVVTISYALDYGLWRRDPTGFHLTNVLLHGLCTLLVGLLLERIGQPPLAAGVAALLFAVHPIHTENVAWIAGRTDLLAFLFTAIAMWLALEKPTLQRSSRRGRRAVAVVFYALAVLAKEAALIAPLWILLIERFVWSQSWTRAARRATPFCSIALAYLIVRFVALDIDAPQALPEHGVDDAFLSALPTLARYLGWLVLPLRLSAYVQNPYVTSLSDPRFLAAVAAFGVLAAWGWWAARRKGWSGTPRARQALLLVAMLLVSFLPVLNLVRVTGPADMGNVMAERFCYFPSFPFAGLVGLAFAGLLQARRRSWRPLAAGALTALVVLASWRTVTRNQDWKDELTLFSLEVQRTPNAPLLWSQLAITQIASGRLADASVSVARLEAMGATSYQALSTRVLWLVMRRRYDAALELQRQIVTSIGRREAPAVNNLAFLHRALGEDERAVELLEGLVRDGVAYADVHYNLGEIFRTRGEVDRARSEYRTALRLKPDGVEVGLRLAELEESAGRLTAAAAVLRGLLRHHPGDGRLQEALGALERRIRSTGG